MISDIQMTSEIDYSQLFCHHKDCSAYGKKNQGNIVFKERYGNNNRVLFKCKICKHCFSESRDTPYFGLSTPAKEVVRTLAMIPEKGGIRGTARANGHDKDTVSRWIKRAGAHCEKVNDHLLKDLNLKLVEVDEIWSYVKKTKKCEGRRSSRIW